MLNRLRDETEELHREIEKGNLAGLIISHTIKEDEYKLLLLQNYIAYAITENEISRHLAGYKSEKSLQLEQDLQRLRVDYSTYFGYKDRFRIKNRAEALGAAYVVEGSALGGMMISKELKDCPSLTHIETHNFFNGSRHSINGWKEYCKFIKNESFSPEEEEQAVQKARETFEFFGRIFKEVRLPDRNIP